MVNYGFNSASLIGLIYVLLSIVYFVSVIGVITRRVSRPINSALSLDVFQAIILPILLLNCGVILISQGWRLDPVLQFQQLSLLVLIIYFTVKDIVAR